MRYLYIDTSSNYLYAGIISNNKLLYQIKKNYGSNLSKYAINEIKIMFENIKFNPNDINKIIVVSGPGSFTGIRIGMTFAKIYSWIKKIDIIPITSLDAMSKSVDINSIIVPIIDARRGYVYAGI